MGVLLFYGGLAGIAISSAGLVISIVMTKKSLKKMLNMLDREY